MSFWEANSKILAAHYPGLLQELAREGAGEAALDLQVEKAASGEPTLRVKGLPVHSLREPGREGRRLAESVAAAVADANAVGASPVVILGFGLGYSAQAVAEAAGAGAGATAQRPIIIVEKYPSILAKALETRDLGSLLLRKNVAFIAGGGEGISEALALFAKGGEKAPPVVMRNKALAGLDEEWYGAVEARIRAWTMKDDVNMATFKRFGKRWVRNLSRNLNAVRDIPGTSRLAGLAVPKEQAPLASQIGQAVQKEQAPFASQIGQAQFARSVALPVFLAAGGPSLDSALPFLGEIRQRAIVVAVDTSMRFFVKNGVAPDFVVVVDPQFWNSRHLDTCLTGGETRLIAESAVYPPVLRLPFKGRFLCGSLFPLGSFIESRVDPKGALGAGGSVATTAWDFCRTLAPSEIWIAGLDLAFPGLKTHFRGALFESIISAQSRRLKPAETMLADALRNGGSFYAPGAGGEPVLTDKRLSLYAAWFENRFRQAAGLRNFRLFSSGLAIANIEKAGIEQFLALPPRRQEIDDRLQAAFAKIDADFFDRQAAQSRADKYEKALSVLRRGLEQVKEASEKGASVARRALAGKTKPGAQNGILKELDEILQSVSNSEVKEVAGFLFPPAENLKAGGSADNAAGTAKAADPFRSYLESSLELFESLAAASSDNLKELV